MLRFFLFFLIFAGFANAQMYRSASQEVIRDSDTRLMWQDNSEAKTVQRNWQGAIDYCSNLKLAGFDDWKLPDRDTLKALYPKQNSLYNMISLFYWSSSSNVSDLSGAWGVYFFSGNDGNDGKSNSNYVRCVRDSSSLRQFDLTSLLNRQKSSKISNNRIELVSKEFMSGEFAVTKDGQNIFGTEKELFEQFSNKKFSSSPFEDIQKFTQQDIDSFLSLANIPEPNVPTPLNLIKDEFDGMDRTALKKYIKTNGLAITVMKSWDDDKIREEIRSAVLTTEEPEEEPKPEPKKSAKKETKKEPTEEEPKDEPKQVKKPSKKEDSKPEKKSEKKEGGKRGEKLDPRNNIDDQKEVIAELAKTFPEKEYLYAWLNTRGVTIKHKGTNSQKGVFTFENMTRREDGEIRCSVWFLCLRKNKELLEEIMDIDTAWDGTPGKKGMTVKEAIEIFNELKDKIENSLQKSDKKLGENRVKMEENIKAGNKRNNKGK